MLASDISKAVFEGNSSATDFPFTFKVWDKSQLVVEITDPQGISHNVYTWTVHLTEIGGTISYMHQGAPLPTGYKLAILRNMPFLQGVDLINGTRFDPAVIEDALDKATAERQQLKEAVSRSLKLDASSIYSPETLIQELRDNTAASTASAAEAAQSEANSLASAAASAASASVAQKSADDAAKSAAEAGYVAGEEAVARVTDEGDAQMIRVHEEGSAIISSMADLARTAFIPGMVVAFTGSFGGPDNLYPIPTGSTEPDMTWKLHEPSRGKFILGGTGQNQKVEGGSETTKDWTLTINQIPRHSHSVEGIDPLATAGGGWQVLSPRVSGSTGTVGGSQPHSHGQNLPPYYTLAYIEKLNVENPSAGHAVFVTHEELEEGLQPKADQASLDELANTTAQTLTQEREITNQALAGKQGTLTAGDNITITPEGVISSTGGGGGGTGGVDYKTTEQDTGLKALDGSPVYQITISVPSWDGAAAVSHGISNITNVYTAKAVVAQGV